jgi:hypothetical protein
MKTMEDFSNILMRCEPTGANVVTAFFERCAIILGGDIHPIISRFDIDYGFNEFLAGLIRPAGSAFNQFAQFFGVIFGHAQSISYRAHFR